MTTEANLSPVHAIAAQKLPIVADRRMLYAEYPIVDGKFALSDKFVRAVKLRWRGGSP